METYNKLYTRMLCLIVEKFHFEVKEVDFVNVVDKRMALLAEDALSAKALKQVEFMKTKEKPAKEEEEKSAKEENEKPVEKEKEEEEEEEEKEVEEEEEEEEEEEMEVEKEEEWLVKEPKALTTIAKQKILRLVLTVVIPDLRKCVCRARLMHRLMITTDDRKNQMVHSGVAVVIVQLLTKLPPKLFDM